MCQPAGKARRRLRLLFGARWRQERTDLRERGVSAQKIARRREAGMAARLCRWTR